MPRKHVVDTDIHFYHVPTHADASRKRITEDTEDWRPRTGTTQSRSFKILAQITGTENGTQLTKVQRVVVVAWISFRAASIRRANKYSKSRILTVCHSLDYLIKPCWCCSYNIINNVGGVR